MRLRNEFALRPTAPDPDGRRRSQVLLSGSEIPVHVVGEDLGAVVELTGKLVLFVLYGDPYEESLQIYVVDDSYRILDRAVLGAMGASGSLRDIRLEPPAMISFSFFGDRRWQLYVFNRPHLSVPIPSLGIGIWRPTQLRRWFKLGPAR
jgi:hypothetical protein